MKSLKLNLKERSYPIIITDDDFKHLASLISGMSLGTDAFIITNPKIFKLYAKRLRYALQAKKITAHFHKVKDSESSKSISEYIKTINKLSAIDTKKRLFLIAFGGGVVGDLTGFIAATYKRGVPYVQIPTTLLAQVDSAIGGKTALDLPSGKNLVGSFYQPRLVYSNIALLKSLPQRQIKCGLAEVIKYGIIIDNKLFTFLEKNYNRILRLDKKSLIHIINTSSAIKARITELDEKETMGLRTILNFGHTIGHALETASRYRNLNHGEAISIGMVCAAEIAQRIKILHPSDLERICRLLKLFKLPIKAKNSDLKAIYKAFYRDKKFVRGKIRMVIPTRIGHTIVTEDIPVSIIKSIIKKRTA